jgi:integrase
MFNLAVREELAERNPCWKIKMLPENNTRDRILSVDELERLLGYLPPHAGRIVHFAYLTGMRAGEIFNLNWDKVDLAQELVRLGAEDTKTSEPRVVFLCGRAYGILKVAGSVRSLDHNRVFTYRGKPIKKIKKAFTNACRKAGIVNFRFHDLRHTFNTNMRKAGVDHSVIMKLTGHKTPSMFQRYNTVDVDDAKLAYRRLEELISQEQAQNVARTKSAPRVLPTAEGEKLQIVSS